MCPSMKVSGNRLFSPKGRATLIREWLRLLAEQNVAPDSLIFAKQSKTAKLVDFVQKVRNQWHKEKEYDFSHEVKAAMDTCLACKACASQCPIKIDVPTFRSQFNELYHRRYFRPLKDHMVSNLEFVAPLMAKAPKLFNFFSTGKVAESLAGHAIGMTDLPALSVPTLNQQLVQIGYQGETLEALESRATSGSINADFGSYLFIVQDPFTSFYDAKVVADFVQLCQKLGFKPIVLPFNPTGKAQHVKGFLHKFAKTAKNQADFLTRVAKLGIPMVGVDAALTLIYREEYKDILKAECGDFKVLLAHEWLVAKLGDIRKKSAESDRLPWHLFSHCTESTALPNSAKEWQQIFAHFGEQLISESTGCCGMAGTFGHETKHLAMSKAIYAQSWQTKLNGKDLTRCLATGYSCRSQVKRMEQHTVKHPIQALLEVV